MRFQEIILLRDGCSVRLDSSIQLPQFLVGKSQVVVIHRIVAAILGSVPKALHGLDQIASLRVRDAAQMPSLRVIRSVSENLKTNCLSCRKLVAMQTFDSARQSVRIGHVVLSLNESPDDAVRVA